MEAKVEVKKVEERFTAPATICELAALFRIHRNSMSKLLRSGAIRSKKIGRMWSISIDDCPHLQQSKILMH